MNAKRLSGMVVLAAVFAGMLATGVVQAQRKEMGEPLQRRELAKLLPDRVFLDGEAPTVQRRNAVGAHMEDGKVVVAMLVDTSGYGADYQEKYVGVLITQGTVYLNAKTLAPGAYGFGRKKSGGDEKVVFYDLGGNPMAEVSAEKHDDLRPVTPIQLREGKNKLRLYLGKFWIRISSRAGD